MPASREEVNFQRLLIRCEEMAAENRSGDWRLEKYVCALQDKLADLKKSQMKPAAELMQDYSKKVDFLKEVIQMEKLPSASEKAMKTQLLAPAKTSGIQHPNSPTVKRSKDLHQQLSSRYANEMRKELLGDNDTFSSTNGVRQRRGDGGTTEDLDAVLQHHHNIQEKLAEEMLSLTRNLKHNSMVAGNIVKEDNRRLEESNKMASTNYSKLKTESERLEVHANKTCNWWVWGPVICVTIIFLWMIFLIRLFPSKA
ncbi:vesicle transport protein USE1-like [Lytechinus pictus]|uniref:vesicle transport protein USE1-like n=1 Tax=Lytechinus pictus TaxID=7653 RepID=UPI0030BA07F0